MADRFRRPTRPAPQDRFGVERLQRVLRSGIREIFTPHSPVADIDLLMDRAPAVQRMLDIATTPGQHGLIFGERGVGKSSLAYVARKHILANLFPDYSDFVQCDSSTTFPLILEKPLRKVGIDIRLTSESSSGTGTGGLALGPPVATLSAAKSTTKAANYAGHQDVSPSRVAEALASLRGMLVVDEFDVVKKEHKYRIAQLIKLLSDRQSPFRLIVVGVAQSATELTAGHESSRRCISEIRLGQMSEDGFVTRHPDGTTPPPRAWDHLVRVRAGHP